MPDDFAEQAHHGWAFRIALSLFSEHIPQTLKASAAFSRSRSVRIGRGWGLAQSVVASSGNAT